MARTGTQKPSQVASATRADFAPRAWPGLAAGPVWGFHTAAMAIVLVLLVVAAFAPCLENEFVLGDDDVNFLENWFYRGLGWPQLVWAWTGFRIGVYQPLAWIALEAQYVVFGLQPRGYHLTSLVLYAIDTVVLFILTLTLLGRCRQGDDQESLASGSSLLSLSSGLGVALFAVHPLRTEVVAWASCQPYLPCALFAMLAVLAYLRAFPDDAPPRRGWVVCAFFLFFAALLSKAVAVSLPVVLLILDVYPLRRLGGESGLGSWFGPSARRVWYEKTPFAALSAVFMVIAVFARANEGHLVPIEDWGLLERITQSCYAIWFYLVKTFVPVNITAFYPMPARAALLSLPYLASVVATLGVSVGLFLQRRRWPALLAVWSSYLVILAPNLGLVQFGHQRAADRYSYIAMIGLVALLSAGICRIGRAVQPRRLAAWGLMTASLGILLGLILLSRDQCLAWRSSEGLWNHVLSHDDYPDPLAHNNLGLAFLEQGRLGEAAAEFSRAVRLKPYYADARNNVGSVLLKQGRLDEAGAQFRDVLRISPGHAGAHNNLGSTLFQQGRFAEAETQFTDALRIQPDHADARNNLGSVLLQEGRTGEALTQFAAALRLKPDHPGAHQNLGSVLARQGHLDQAMAHFAEAVRLMPGDAEAHNNLGTALLQQGRLDEAVAEYTRALRLQPGNADAHNNLGSALGRRGRLDEAVAQFQEALRLKPDHAGAQGNLRVAEALRRERSRPQGK